MRWMVTEFVAKLATKNATTSTQKTAIRADARSVRPGTRPSARSAPGVPDPRRGAGRSMSAWSGMVSTARMTARASSAPRHDHAHREGAGDLDARPAEVGLHRAEQDGEAVVEDAPRDDLGDTECRDDDPAVGEAPRIGHRRATLCAPRRSVNCSVYENRGVPRSQLSPGARNGIM